MPELKTDYVARKPPTFDRLKQSTRLALNPAGASA